MQIHIKTIHDSSAAAGWAGPRSLVIDRTPRAGGLGIGFSGEELFMMSIGASICNDLYREAAKMQIELERIEVSCESKFEAEGAAGSDFRYRVKIQSKASPEALNKLIVHTDQVAEIQNTLRKGAHVTLEI